MPCQRNCEIIQLNARLRDIKLDKISTLRQILEVTEELGRDQPHRRAEVTRSKREIERKLMSATAELMYLEEEITNGCSACQEN